MLDENELLFDVKKKCLDTAIALLDAKTAPTARTAEAVCYLIKVAIDIEDLNIRHRVGGKLDGTVFGATHSRFKSVPKTTINPPVPKKFSAVD